MENQIIDPLCNSFRWKKIKHPKFKYEVLKAYDIKLNFEPDEPIYNDYYTFFPNGHLVLFPGYRWDGASGPTIDTISTMRASCVHDALYQMIRLGQLSRDKKHFADLELKRIMLEDYHPTWDGAVLWSEFRADYYYQAVNLFGFLACRSVV